MNNFTFKNPTKIIFGKGEIAKLSQEISKGTKILMTYGGGSIKQNGVYDQVIKALEGYDIIEFGGIEANPQCSTLMKAIEIVKRENIELILAVGGGSTIDGSKFIATGARYDSNPWEFMVDHSLFQDIIPVKLASVLTLPATASEMNCGAVISNKEIGEKLAFLHPLNYPQFSILDPEVCYSLPDKQVANGLVDTFVHTLEQYLTHHDNGMIQDRFAEGVLSTIKEVGPKLLKDRTNYELNANFMLSATMGLNGILGLGSAEDWATHMIGHELTAFYGLDHGVTLAIVGPALFEVMKEEKSAKLLQYGERVWGINAGSEQERIDATIKATRNFYESLGVKTRLSQHGIGTDNFEAIAKRFEARGWVLGENASITPAKVVEILNKAL